MMGASGGAAMPALARAVTTHQALEDELDAMIKEGRLPEAHRRGTLAILEPPVVETGTDSRNAHRLDDHVRFEPEGHKYYLRQEKGEVIFPISVSGVWAQYFAHFDAEATSARHKNFS